MSAWTHDVARSDIEDALFGWNLEKRAGYVTSEISKAAGELESTMRGIGYKVPFPSGQLGYDRAQTFLISRVAATVIDSTNQGDTERSRKLDTRADRILKEMRLRPETLTTAWNTNEQMGSWQSDQVLTEQPPGSFAPVRHWTRGGF